MLQTPGAVDRAGRDGTGKVAGISAAQWDQVQLVVSAATRQLSDQLFNSDVPIADAVRSLDGRILSAVSLKGRGQPVSGARVDGSRQLGGAANETAPTEPEADALDLGIEIPEPVVVEQDKPRRPTSGRSAGTQRGSWVG